MAEGVVFVRQGRCLAEDVELLWCNMTLAISLCFGSPTGFSDWGEAVAWF